MSRPLLLLQELDVQRGLRPASPPPHPLELGSMPEAGVRNSSVARFSGFSIPTKIVADAGELLSPDLVLVQRWPS